MVQNSASRLLTNSLLHIRDRDRYRVPGEQLPETRRFSCGQRPRSDFVHGLLVLDYSGGSSDVVKAGG